MNKFVNIILFLLIIIFLFIIFKYYSSSKNIESKNYIRNNIDQILIEKSKNLKILENDTNNVIEFNDIFENEKNEIKKRSFWELLKNK